MQGHDAGGSRLRRAAGRAGAAGAGARRWRPAHRGRRRLLQARRLAGGAGRRRARRQGAGCNARGRDPGGGTRARGCLSSSPPREGAALHLDRLRTRAARFRSRRARPADRRRDGAGLAGGQGAEVPPLVSRRRCSSCSTASMPSWRRPRPSRRPRIGQQTMVLDGAEVPLRPNIGIFTQPISFIGLPVVAVPVPLAPLPIGVQIIAAPWREDVALRIAHALEKSKVAAAPRPRRVGEEQPWRSTCPRWWPRCARRSSATSRRWSPTTWRRWTPCSARTRARIRYGIAENLYGHEEVAAFRAARSPVSLMRTRSRTVITTYGRDFAVASTLFHREARRQGRPADADLGALSRGLARGRRARQPHRCARAELMRDHAPTHRISRSTSRGLHAGLRAAVSTRPTSSSTCSTRSRRADDPGIFIALADRKAVRKAAQKLGRFDPRPSRCGASRSPSRTTSTSAGLPTTAACPAFAYTPEGQRDRGRAPAGRRRAADRQDQPRPVRHRPRRRAHALSGAAECHRPRHRAGRVELRLGGGGGARDLCRSRSAPTRRARAACRPGLNNIVGLKPSVGAVSTRGVVPACRTLDCVSVFAGTRGRRLGGLRGDGRRRRRRSVLAADRARGARRRRRTPTVIGMPRPEDLKFFGDAAAKAAWRPSVKVLQGARRDGCRRRHDAVLRQPPRCSTRGLGGRALCRDRARSWRSTRSDVHPVTRQHHREGEGLLRRRCLRRHLSAGRR